MSSTDLIARPAQAIRSALQPLLYSGQTYVPTLALNSRRAPRVLHVITPSKMAGAETFLARMMRRATLDQFVSHLVTSRNRANRELLAANLPFDRIGIGGKANLLAVPRLAIAARRFQADVLHSHLSTASWWSGWLEQFGGPPSIGHVHGFTSAHWHRRQSHLIACSEAVKQDLVEKGIAAQRITVMHYPTDPADIRPSRPAAAVRRELGAEPDTPVVGTFAHLSPKKGHRELVRAAALVLSCFPQAQFWCFGDGPLRAEIQETACQLGIADRFRLFGFRRDVADLMQAIDVMCLPSRREPFGLVYVEAALAKKPVIACDAGGAPEVVVHGDTGLLVAPSEVAQLADAIFTLLDNRSAAVAMGERGREFALSRFTWARYISQLRNVYDRVLDERRGASSAA
ncbi:MAG TPA: glycosyltransferase family 4 protein [Lacipirellulaceae bacterium]|nr:glycosyltransferase family 4 protein [Lacipirellulaceae bacterium]